MMPFARSFISVWGGGAGREGRELWAPVIGVTPDDTENAQPLETDAEPSPRALGSKPGGDAGDSRIWMQNHHNINASKLVQHNKVITKSL